MTPLPEDWIELVKGHLDLGHAKRDASLLRQIRLALAAPGASLPQAAAHGESNWADLMAWYRYARNEQIALPDIRRARALAVADRVALGADVVIVHDPTQLDYSSHHSKKDRRPIGDHRGMGYEYVSCIAIEPHSGDFLGVVHDTVISLEGPHDADVMDYDYEPLFADFDDEEKQRLRENHRHQMAVHMRGLAPVFAGRNVIHVADREFDDIFVLHNARQTQRSFVIRSTANRNVQVPGAPWIPDEALAAKQAGHRCEGGWVCVNLTRLVNAVPLEPYKTLALDKKGRVVFGGKVARFAKLSIGGCRVRLYRRAKRNGRYFRPPQPIDVHMVVIREENPPPGVTALRWVLFTDLPIDTPEELAWVAHLYELRWKVEEYYRLLKSGYHIEKLRFHDARRIARTLVVLSIAAVATLNLKRKVQLPARGRLSDEDYERVKTAVRNIKNPTLPLELCLFALVVKYGGWIGRRQDPIGPTILMRGLLQVLAMLDALSRYGPVLIQALEHPEVIRSLFCV